MKRAARTAPGPTKSASAQGSSGASTSKRQSDARPEKRAAPQRTQRAAPSRDKKMLKGTFNGTHKDTLLSPAAITEIFRRFAKADPEPKSELEYVNPYTLLVAVVLSAQATDAGVNKATRSLFKVADTPQKMVRLGEEKVRDYVKTIGLYRNKARNIILLSQRLLDEHGGEVPRDRDALEQLPGVGRKTANVVLNVVFGEPTMAVDTHVFRVARRTGLSTGDTPLAVEEDLIRVVPAKYALHAHHWLILHGRYVCKARVPECPRCIIRDLCLYEAKTL
jgi:endonuclease-3